MSLDVKRISAFADHTRTCETCRRARYAYLDCEVGLRLAREAMTPMPWRGGQK